MVLETSERDRVLLIGTLGYSYFQSKGVSTFEEACKHVASLPYARNTNKGDLLCILDEGRGTCSTKHVFIKTLADQLDIQSLKLYVGIFRMNKTVFPILGEILNESGLAFIPEAHTYLRVGETIYDYTMPENSIINFEGELMLEQEMDAMELNDLKVPFHREFIERWIQEENVPYTLNEVWEVRERCIQRLSEGNV
jgi:hypothetical protein